MPTREEKRKEAIERLAMLEGKGLMPCVRRDFENDGTVYYSEFNGMCGALYYLNDLGGADPKWNELVEKYEKENNALVYHVTHEWTDFGELLDLLVITDYDEEWEYEREALVDGYAYAYVNNLTYSDYSELGSIAIRVIGGGVVRVS